MKNFLLPLLAAVTLPTIAVAHPLPHGQGGPLEGINHSVVSPKSVLETHGYGAMKCETLQACCKLYPTVCPRPLPGEQRSL